jgi:hypothetical protein
MSHLSATKPNTSHEYHAKWNGGTFEAHTNSRIDTAFLELSNGSLLGVISEKNGVDGLNYVEYHNGKTLYPSLAIAVDKDGVVSLQVLVDEEGSETSRIKTIIGLENILAVVAANT